MPNNLEKSVKQNIPFKDAYVKAVVGLMYLSNQVFDKQQQFLKPHGITVQQYNVLRILRGQLPNPANIALIKDRMLDKMCDASRIVDRLVKLNLATKKQSAIDKRHSSVFITDHALKLLKLIDEVQAAHLSLLHNLSEQEVEELNKIIDKALA